MKAVITITDNPNGTIEVSIHCDPPLVPSQATNAGLATLACLEAIKSRATRIGSTEITTRKTKPDNKN